MADGFLGRWAKRKNDALQGKPLDEPAAPPPAQPVKGAVAGGASGANFGANFGVTPPNLPAKTGTVAPGAAEQDPAAEPPAPPTLDDVQGLTKDSDFKPFMNKAVEPGVRNAAMKKLFADPHFNVMDRMDVYIDDYSLPDPIPAAMLRQMTSAKFLKLFDEEEEPSPEKPSQEEPSQPAAAALPPEKNTQSVAETAVQDPPLGDNPAPLGPLAEPAPHQDDHAHIDLRLQPDHAAQSPESGRGAA